MKIRILLIFCLITVLLRLAAVYDREWTESWYAQGLFAGIRRVLDPVFQWIDIPFWYLFWMLIAVWLIWSIRYVFFKGNSKIDKRRAAFRVLAVFSATVIILFNWLWGFNYARVPLESRLGIIPLTLDSAAIAAELDTAMAQLAAANDAKSYGVQDSFEESMEDRTRRYLTATLRDLGYTTPGRPRVHAIQPNGMLLRLGVLGVYWPFIGQGQIDHALPSQLKPYVFVHEMAHAYGFTDEGVCNFLAYLACRQYGDRAFRYSADLAYFRSVAGQYRSIDSVAYAKKRMLLPEGVIADLDSINAGLKKYPTWFSTTAVYDWYLKAEGIEEGVNNYDNVISLVHTWRKKKREPLFKK